MSDRCRKIQNRGGETNRTRVRKRKYIGRERERERERERNLRLLCQKGCREFDEINRRDS